MDTIKVLINNEKCIGCGSCAADCPSRVIEVKNERAPIESAACLKCGQCFSSCLSIDACMKCKICIASAACVLRNGKAVITSERCLKCGHCFAVCPKGAVSTEGLSDTVIESGKDDFLNAESLLRHLKLRRSVRQYKSIPVERDKIEMIIEAGRLTPTGTNSQNVRYIVIQDSVAEIEDIILARYKRLLRIAKPFAKLIGRVVGYDITRYKAERGFLFHGAPVVILAVSPSASNALLAAMNMELMAEALGLGVLHVGLFTGPANKDRRLKKLLGIGKGERICATLALGYPDVRYLRSAKRKKVNAEYR